jgi:hypothetical protein
VLAGAGTQTSALAFGGHIFYQEVTKQQQKNGQVQEQRINKNNNGKLIWQNI